MAKRQSSLGGRTSLKRGGTALKRSRTSSSKALSSSRSTPAARTTASAPAAPRSRAGTAERRSIPLGATAAVTPAAQPDSRFANHPLVAEGRLSAQQLEDYYERHGSMPVYNRNPDGSVSFGRTTAESLGVDQGGTRISTAGVTPIGAPGSTYVPQSVMEAAQQASSSPTGQAGLIQELYDRAGVSDAMAGGPPEPLTGAAGPTSHRSRASGIQQARDAGATIPGMAPTNAVQSFVDWFEGRGPRMEGDLGEIYNMPEGIETPAGELIMPGFIGQAFGNNPALLAERVQAQQLLDDQQPYGPLSPMLPPHLLLEAGYGPGDVLGGQWSLGQTVAADPSLQGVTNQGAFDYFANQTPTGPYAGFEFPQAFGQPQGAGSTFLPPGLGTNFNPPPGFTGDGGGWTPPSGGTTGPNGGAGFQPNPFPPIAGGGGGDGGPTTPGAGTGGGAGSPFPAFNFDTGGAADTGVTGPDQFLAGLGPNVGYLEDIAANQGYPTDVAPAWEAMVAAQQRNLDRRFADLAEGFGARGLGISSPFAQAATDFWTQAGLDQNAMLGQLVLQSQEAARGRELGAAGQLAGLGTGAAQQLSSQGFQAAMNQMNQQYQAARDLYGGSLQGARDLLQGSIAGTQGLYGLESQAGLTEAQRQMALQQLGLGAGVDLSNLWRQNLQTGGALGQQNYGIMQDQINRLYNEWLRSQPQYNPMLPYMYSGATGYPPTAFPQYAPPTLPGTLGAAGQLLASLQGIIPGLGGQSAVGNMGNLAGTLMQGSIGF